MAILLLGAAAFFDQHRTSMDRPHDFYASQFLASVGAGMFMGPLIMLGISAALKQGVDHMITFLVTLSITQTLGAWPDRRCWVPSSCIANSCTPAR